MTHIAILEQVNASERLPTYRDCHGACLLASYSYDIIFFSVCKEFMEHLRKKFALVNQPNLCYNHKRSFGLESHTDITDCAAVFGSVNGTT